MSAIAAVTVTSVQVLPPAAANPPAQTTAETDAGSGSGNADQPAIIVSLSGNGAAASQAPKELGSLDPNAVDDAIYAASGANGFALI